MTTTRRLSLVLVLSALMFPGSAHLAQENPTYEGRLSPRPIDGRLRGQLTGLGRVTAVLEGNELRIAGEFGGMQTPATGATLRRGVDSGVAGPRFADLEVVRATRGLVYGSAVLNPSQLDALDRGAVYVQIDGEGAEDGTLWGFLIRD